MEVNCAEIYRYLGYGRTEPDERIREEVRTCLSELMSAARPRLFHREFPLTLGPDYKIDGTCFITKSESLWKNLSGCELVIVFAATLGSGVDLLLRRYGRLSMSRALMLQAAATAVIEEYCDQENDRLKDEYRNRGYDLRPRFSPGYGDFHLSVQPDLLRALEAEKHVGITLTDSLIMIPSKSVTAVVGAGRRLSGSLGKEPVKCEICNHEECIYRRSGQNKIGGCYR